MKTVKAKGNQTIIDVALEQYGNLEAMGEILANNPDLTNDPVVLSRLGIEHIDAVDFYIDLALEPGIDIIIDEDSPLIKSSERKQIPAEITTFDL